MARKPQRPKKPLSPAAKAEASAEQRRGEVVTVFWMLTTLITVAALLVTAALRAVLWFQDGPLPERLAVLPGLMLFTALICGLLVLILTAATLWFRRQPPPTPITVFAVCVGLAPLAAVALLALSS